MNISSVSNSYSSSLSKKENINNNKGNSQKSFPSFKAIYIEDDVNLGLDAEKRFPPKFRRKDALLLNDIAAQYPHQDCFIKSGSGGYPKLEFRERPPEIQVFSEKAGNRYRTEIRSSDEDFPAIPLILKQDNFLNRIIGLPSSKYSSPSLPETIKAGFELHKIYLNKKYEILDLVSGTTGVDFGENNDWKSMANEEVKKAEHSVVRYLLESAYENLSNPPALYDEIALNTETTLDQKRQIELTTSNSFLSKLRLEAQQGTSLDIIEEAKKRYPVEEENLDRIEELTIKMFEEGKILG